MKKFKVGDKVFCEYEHATITNIKNGKVTGVSFKYFMRSSQDLTGRCFLVSESDESICNRFLNAESFLRKICRHLNWPYIHSYFVNMWVDAMIVGNVSMIYAELDKFCLDVEKALRDLKINNIEILRP